MPLDPEAIHTEPKTEGWDELQREFGSSDVHFDNDAIERTAGGSNEQVVRSVTDSLWAGSATLNEQFELERNLQELIDEGRSYPEMEKSLTAYGYARTNIRRVFNKLTGIDPVMAYVDMTTYTIPPDAVPRYNYGWGPAKNAKADYFFILPFLSKYAIYQLTGLNKEIVFEHLSLEETRDELKKYVKDIRAVSMDTLDTTSDIIQRVASIQAPTFQSEAANKLAAVVHGLKLQGEAELATKMIEAEFHDNKFDQADREQLLAYAAESTDPSEMSAEDKERMQQLEKYQREQEGRTIEDETSSIKMPQNDFHDKLEDENKVSMKELTSDAYDLLTEIGQTIPGYNIEPQGQTVDLVDVSAYSADESNHIDTGSIRFLVAMTDLRTQQVRKALVIMFIVNGKLQYSGKFKGEDNREYALSTPGVHAYFDGLEGKSVEDLHFTPQSIPHAEQVGPNRS